MGAFDDIKLTWADKEYVIPANRVLGAVARIEDVITLTELSRFGGRNTAPMAKIAMAFGAVLRYAGATITDDEVYGQMFTGENRAQQIVDSVSVLISMMVPPVREGEPSQGNAVPAASTSSKKPTRPRSAPTK